MAFYEDEEVIFDITFYSDTDRDTPVDPVSAVLEVESPSGSVDTPTVSQDGSRPANVGKYTAAHIVDEWGTWNWRWETSTPRIVKQGSFKVEQNII